MKIWSYLMAVIILLLTGSSFAEDSNLKFGGKLWSQFMYDMTTYPAPGTTSPSVTTANKMGLDIYRAYFHANYKFDDTWSTFILFEGSRSSVVTTATTSETNVVQVRNLYVQNSKVFGDMTFKFGYMPTPYTLILDGYTKARWLSTNLNDNAAGGVTPPGGVVKTIGFTPAHAGGAQLSGDFFEKALKFNLMIHNGVEGLTLAGNNDTGLSYLALVDIMPFKNSDSDLKNLGLIISNDYTSPARLINSTTATPAANTNVTEGANLTEVALHYQSALFDGAIEYGQQSESVIYGVTNPDSASTGWGVTGTFKFMDDKLGIFGRYITGSSQFQNYKLNAGSYLTFGPTWTFTPDKMMTALLAEVKTPSPNTNLSSGTASASTVTSTTIYWKWAANF